MVQRLKTLLGSSQELRPLLAKAEVLSELRRRFAAVAPPGLAGSGRLQVLGLHLGTLSIAVANPGIAAKIRQLAPQLAVLMRRSGFDVSGIRVKVQVSAEPPRPAPVPRRLGHSAQKALDEFSRTLDESPLKHALERMAKKP